jgi:hypothetical protein
MGDANDHGEDQTQPQDVGDESEPSEEEQQHQCEYQQHDDLLIGLQE